MTSVASSIRAPATRIPLLPEGWPLVALFGLLPLWWLLGMTGFIWPIVAVPMLIDLIGRPAVAVPRGFGWWALFLAWMFASLLMLNGEASPLVALHRSSLYLSATVVFVYVYNLSIAAIPRLVSALAWLWTAIVTIGVVALALPTLEFPGLLARVLPSGLTNTLYVRELMTVRLSQVHDFLGFPVPRPTGPFSYTNEWGSAFALLVPFVIVAVALRRRPWRTAWPILALVSLVPLVVSLDRGAWLSLSLGAVYVALRFALRGRLGAVAGMLVAIATVGILLVGTPLGGLLVQRIQTGHSDQGRLEIYTGVVQAVEQSPLFGYGAPRATSNAHLPELGTHGAVWLVLFSHGVPALILFLSLPVIAVWRSRRAMSPTRFWAHVVVVIALVQMPYYDMLPVHLHLVLAAAALAFRSDLDEGFDRGLADRVDERFDEPGPSRDSARSRSTFRVPENRNYDMYD